MHNLNKHCPSQAHLILTDPYLCDNEILMKPFTNQLKVHYCPINPSVNYAELNTIIRNLKPRHIISPYTVVSQVKAPGESAGGYEENKVETSCLSVSHTNCVVDQILAGQTIQLSEEELGSLKYRGKCPTSIASLIKMQSAAGGVQLSRVTDLQLEFKDSKYQITGISVPKEELG